MKNIILMILLSSVFNMHSDEKAFKIIQRLSAMQTHGELHNHLSINDKKKRFKNDQVLVLTCGKITDLARAILKDYQTRHISTLTADDKNGFDDGHVLFEIKINGKFIAVDIDMNRYFTDDKGRLLSLADAKRALFNGNLYYKQISKNKSLIHPLREALNNWKDR